MSCINLVRAMRAKELSLATRFVWQCLENRSRARFCQMSIEEIHEELGVCPDTITVALKTLESIGIIRIERHRRRKSVYHMLVSSEGQEDTPETELTPIVPRPTVPELIPEDPGQTPDLTPDHPGQSSFSLEGTSERVRTRKKEPTRKEVPTRARALDAHVVLPSVADIQIVINAWDAMASEAGLATIRGMSAAREKSLRMLLVKHGMEEVLEVIGKIGQSDFCRGKVKVRDRKPFKATFDWFIGQEMFLRTLEGKYDNHEAPSRYGDWGAGIDAAAEQAKSQQEQRA